MAAILYPKLCQGICKHCWLDIVSVWMRAPHAMAVNESFVLRRKLSTNHDESSNHQNKKFPPPHSEQGSGGLQLQGTQTHKKQVHSSWRPTKRLLWHQIDHLRSLRQEDPKEWTHSKLAMQFGISVSAVTRILKSKFVPPLEVAERQDALAQRQQQERREAWRTRRSDEG